MVSKQSKWCFIVSFFFYDLTETIIYFADGYYISTLFEILFWMPILLVSFFSWNKHQDKEDATITEVKKINLKRDTLIFLSVLSISFITGIIFTYIGLISEGLSDY